jgi:hypothetical protein
MLEVSRDAVGAEEEKFASCAAGQRKYCFICTVTLDPYGDFPFTSWGRSFWQCRRGDAEAGLNSGYAACGCGTKYRCCALPGDACGDMLEAMARIAPYQPNEPMARVAPRSPMVPMVNNKISLAPS